MFEKAARLKLRFDSRVGNLSVEDLWDLPLTKLNDLAKSLNKQTKESKEEDFLEEKSSEDTITQLKFDIVLHILKTKKDEKEAKNQAAAKKAEREKILEILSKKKEEALISLDEETLNKRLEELK